MTTKNKTSIVWFKRDLRIHDHAPLAIAAEESDLVIPLYIFEPELWQQPDSAFRHWHFIRESLNELNQNLSQRGQPLIIRIGNAVDVFRDLISSTPVSTIYAHEETGNLWTYKRDNDVRAFLKNSGIPLIEFPSNGVVRRLPSRDAWSSYHRKRMEQDQALPPPSLQKIPLLESHPINTIDRSIFHDDAFKHIQKGGRIKGQDLLASFADSRAKRYRATLSSPVDSHQFSSRLSPHLTYGTLSVKEVFHALGRFSDPQLDISPSCRGGIQAMLGRLHWRCHFVQKIEDQPEIETHCMHPFFEGMRQPGSTPDRLHAWFHGQTGYPMVDAVMRCLQQTGWVNFRMRAMVTSFASYDLWLDWRDTGPLLARLFTDYEPGIHYSQMQMQSGVTGINTFRIYNPIKQSQDHDPQGQFIRRFIPELEHVPNDFIHEPWKIPSGLRTRYNCVLDKDYPKPIVDHKTSVKEARTKIGEVLRRHGFREEAKHVYNKLGSRRSRQSRPFRQKPPQPKKESRQLQFDFMNEDED